MYTLAMMFQETSQAAVSSTGDQQSSGGGWWSTVLLILLAGIVVWQWVRARNRSAKMATQVGTTLREAQKLENDIKQKDQRIQTLEEELSRRPEFKEERHPIATIGVSGCGKTALTLKWTNPLIDISLIPATKKHQIYSKPVSMVRLANGNLNLHSIEVTDRGGEFIQEALDQLIVNGVEALVLVVDVGEWDQNTKKQVFTMERIKKQMGHFNRHVLELFFTPRITQKCKNYLLFINKTDVLQETLTNATPEVIKEKACELYKEMIDQLKQIAKKFSVNLHVITGSASTGEGTPQLYGPLLEKLLPPQARDEALKYIPAGYGPGTPPETTNRHISTQEI